MQQNAMDIAYDDMRNFYFEMMLDWNTKRKKKRMCNDSDSDLNENIQVRKVPYEDTKKNVVKSELCWIYGFRCLVHYEWMGMIKSDW